MKIKETELTTLFNLYYEIETPAEKIIFAREKLFHDKRVLSKSFENINSESEKLEFIEEYIENSQLQSNTYTEDANNKKINFKNEFVIAFTDNLEKLAFELEVSNAELKVITYILKKMEFGNLITLKQAAITVALNMKKSNMSAIFKSLKKKNILIQDEEKNLYMNSNIFAKGLNHKMKRDKREDLKKSQKESDLITRSY